MVLWAKIHAKVSDFGISIDFRKSIEMFVFKIGDSGGPVMDKIKPDAEHIHFYLVGLVSFGPSPCGIEGWPSVTTVCSKPFSLSHGNLKEKITSFVSIESFRVHRLDIVAYENIVKSMQLHSMDAEL